MKTLCSIVLFLLLAMPCAAQVAPSMEDSGLVVLSVVGDGVRVRHEPHLRDNILAGLDSGAILVAEKWPILDENMSWYRIVGLVGKESGRVTGALQAFPNAHAYPYVSAAFVKPYIGEFSNGDISKQIMATPYGAGYSAVDFSCEVQRKMAEQRTLRWVFAPNEGGNIPVYAQPSAASEIQGHYSEKNDHLVVVDNSRSGWLFVVDLSAGAPSGWVESHLLEVADRKEGGGDGRESGYQVALNLGANVAEILRRWGPETVVERRVEKNVYTFNGGTEYEEKMLAVSVQTRISAEGFTLTYTDYNNFDFILIRPGAGLGGIFVGEDWCDKEYIQRVFGNISPLEFIPDKGIERCTIQGGPDGWQFLIILEFNSQGQISKFSYRCWDVVLN